MLVELRKELAETYEAGEEQMLKLATDEGNDFIYEPPQIKPAISGNVQPYKEMQAIFFLVGISVARSDFWNWSGDKRELKHHLLLIYGPLVREKTWSLCIYTGYTGSLLDRQFGVTKLDILTISDP